MYLASKSFSQHLDQRTWTGRDLRLLHALVPVSDKDTGSLHGFRAWLSTHMNLRALVS